MDKLEVSKRAEDYARHEDNPVFRKEVQDLLDRGAWEELADRFFRDLEFGTGGLRGVIGGGFNRMNTLVVRRTTQGLAEYALAASGGKPPAAVIAHDSRRYSDVFALDAALVLAAHGIKTYLFSALRPTPELSFAVRRLRAGLGIVVTASHNPPEYNGYKVYWSDGAQVVPPEDAGIIRQVLSVKLPVACMSEAEALRAGLLVRIDEEIDAPYCAMVQAQLLRAGLLRSFASKLKVVYTPLHGTGGMLLERVLAAQGLGLICVPEQSRPDGDFPTVKSPNPEEAAALKMAIELARSVKAQLVLATDPDADRLGVAVADGGDFRLLSGNEMGALLADYIFMTRREFKRMPARPAFIKTIVTSELQRAIADEYGVACFDVLTGFKYIAQLIRQWEAGPDGHAFICGGEESYGYLTTTEVRDKDAVSAAALTVEMAAYYLSRDLSLLERLHELFRRHGWFREEQLGRTFKGERGMKTMAAIMDALRASPPRLLGGRPVLAVKDYASGETFAPTGGKRKRDIELPSSNVLQFLLEGGHLVSARPSGTEPKIKFYISVRTAPGLQRAAALPELEGLAKAVRTDLEKLMLKAAPEECG